MTALTCPKCQSPMRSYERSGVTVDQCTSCQGVFLDRGELEKLVQAEDTHYGGPGGQQAPGQPAPYPGQPGPYGQQRGGFLEQLLGGGGYRRGGHH